MSNFKITLPPSSKILDSEFTLGVATSSFQIEGAVSEDGRIPSIWDTFCEQPNKVKNGDTGNPACEHYKRWEEDLDLVKEMGFEAYRLSIAWPRVMDDKGQANQKGLDFYKKLLDRLQKLEIKSYVTLYHWDLPQYLEDRGGWLNRDLAFRFQDYADLVSRALGDSVYSFSTLNEPWCSAFLGYGYGVHAPGHSNIRYAKQSGHHLLLAHGLAMQVLSTNVPNCQNGIVLNMGPMSPKTHRYDDYIASKIAEAGGNHWFLEPILEGNYPHIVNRFEPNVEPLVLEHDLKIISHPVDYIGINYYTRNIGSYSKDKFLELSQNPDAEKTDMDWEIYPKGLTDLLIELNSQYDLPPLMITENGAATVDSLVDGKISDEQRCRYFDMHLNAVHEAIESGVDISGYFAWSLLDNFEWAEGYEKRFGLVFVDFETQERVLKNSAFAFQELLNLKHKNEN